MPDVLLKRWNDWSAGIGHLVDDGRTPGMYSASGLLGLRGELRPAPLINVAGGVGNAIAGYTLSAASAFAIGAVAVQPAAGAEADIGGGTYDSITNNAVLTFAYTSPGDNRCLVVVVMNTGAAAPTGVTADGDAMTLVGSAIEGAALTLSFWQKASPAAAGNVIVTFAAAHDIVAGAVQVAGVHQTTPIGTFYSNSSAATTNPAAEVVEDPENDSAILCAIAAQNVAVTPSAGQAALFTRVENATIRGAASSFKNPGLLSTPSYRPQYFLEEPATSDSAVPFLYVEQGHARGDLGVYANKVILSNTNFGNILSGHHEIKAPLVTKNYAGQMARHLGLWHFPAGNDYEPRELTVIGTGAPATDTLTAAAPAFVPGADHLGNLESQLIGVVEDGTNPGGARILKVDGAPRTAADWGEDFPVGDRKERPGGVATLGGASFVMNREGLFSFNSKGRSRLVFEDLRSWPNRFKNSPLSPRQGGLLLDHPSGLLFYAPGEEPVDVGLDSIPQGESLPPSGPTELHGGIRHSAVVTGQSTYMLYQYNPSEYDALVLYGCANPKDPLQMVWQGLGTVTLQPVDDLAGCAVTLKGYPVSSDYTTPVLWFGGDDSLNYVVLSPRATPFRSRADTHKVTLSADAYMSELFFAEPVKLTRLVVHTSADMADGDEWQISLIPDGTGKDENVGPPVKGSGTRHERKLNRHSVSRLVLRVNWAATSAADRVPPVITRIELYGGPEKESASAPRSD